MGVQLAEARREVAMLHRRDVLVLEEDHLAVQKGGADLGDLLVGERLGQVDSLDDAADGGGELLDRELGHAWPPVPPFKLRTGRCGESEIRPHAMQNPERISDSEAAPDKILSPVWFRT